MKATVEHVGGVKILTPMGEQLDWSTAQEFKWSLTTLREKLIKIGAKIVRHARYVTFQMAEVAIPRKLFRAILQRIARLKMKSPLPVPG